MAAVVFAGLVMEPEFAAARVAVEELRQVGGPETGGLESLAVLNQETAHLPIGVGICVQAQLLAPLRKRGIENRGQVLNAGAVPHVGEQDEVFAGDFAD